MQLILSEVLYILNLIYGLNVFYAHLQTESPENQFCFLSNVDNSGLFYK
jgi:hypothetical protein